MKPQARKLNGESGVALVLVLLILVALTFAATGLMTSSQRDVASVGREVAKQAAIFGADAGLQSGRSWFRSKQYFGPPQRANAAAIATSTDTGYWNIRNFGGLGSNGSSTVKNFQSITPDMTVNSGKTRVWFQVATLPGSVSFQTRQTGEEAGKTVKYTFELQSVSTHGGVGNVTISQLVSQVYSLNFYSG
ncbi:MAG: hypothetical protein IPK07_28655 [Deltaproteobacteria bacterium]|nr:hypothetical protein [Deltaproteobacteria bacterium]